MLNFSNYILGAAWNLTCKHETEIDVRISVLERTVSPGVHSTLNPKLLQLVKPWWHGGNAQKKTEGPGERSDLWESDWINVCSRTFRSLARVSGIMLIKLVSNGFNYSQPSVSSFTSADPIKLGSIGLFLGVPLKTQVNWAEWAKLCEWAVVFASISQANLRQTFKTLQQW